ncbi:MAG: CRISPR-associated protein Cas4, partial [Dehalococcoidia bacterium]|nr:CRISPR-associated protein Cas4 [Dehalococcoidia bacterium]
MSAPWTDDDYIPLSAIEHLSYCPRQCALIHIEQTYEENAFTLRGMLSHQRVDAGQTTKMGETRVVRSLPVWSDRLGISGVADVVELTEFGPRPVEYKSGAQSARHAEPQLCAQALCLEEMFGVAVPEGVIVITSSRRRRVVQIGSALRTRTEQLIEQARTLFRAQRLPPAL